MKIAIVNNGVDSILLSSETEKELLNLKDMAKGPVTFTLHDTLQVLDKVYANCVVITPVIKIDKQ